MRAPGRARGAAAPRRPPRLEAVGLAVTLLAAAAPEGAVGQAGPLGSLPGSTRSAGLGGAGAALVGDAGAIFANPAAIATVHRMAFDGSYEQVSGGNTFGAAALAVRAGRFDWGAGAQALGDRSIASGDVLGVSSLVFRTGVVALGGTAKYTRQTVGGVRADAWAGDAGLAIAVFDILALGVSVQNIGGTFGAGGGGGGGGSGAGAAHLPRRTRAGFTMNYVDPQGTARLLTTVEGQWPDTGAAFVIVGVEGGIVAHGLGVIGRAGYAGHSVTSAASPFSFGATVALGRLQIDYAYRAIAGPGADTQRFGLRWTP